MNIPGENMTAMTWRVHLRTAGTHLRTTGTHLRTGGMNLLIEGSLRLTG